MIGPMADLGFFGREVGIIMAMLIGFLFGFSLERAGFSSAKRLCDVWYGRDFAVIRVMFTAVIVAMIGLFGLHYAGLIDFPLVFVNPTYVWPQLVGAVVMGIGFAVGGFCPGTTIVSSAIGRLDAMVFLVGFIAGVVAFTLTFPAIESFYNSGEMGRQLLSDVTPLSSGVWVAIITIFGVVAFVVLRRIENLVNGK